MHQVLLSLFCSVVALAFGAAAAWFLMPPAALLDVVARLERGRAGLVAKTVDVGGHAVAYLDGGSDAGTPLLLVHGSSGDKDNWNRVARFLTPHRRVIAVDLPGFGDSARWPAHGLGLPDQVAALAAIIDALGFRQVHLGGSSMGGRLVALYAAAYPHRLRSLWLLAPGGVLSAVPSDLQRHLQAGGDNPLFIRSHAAYDAYLRWLMPAPPRIPAPLKRAMADRALRKADFHRSVFDAAATETVSLERSVDGLTVPTRIVWGERDRIWHVSGAARLAAHLARASVLLLPGGHVPMIEFGKAVAADYLAFLSSFAKQ
jgi:pimeloyl-ACP methyl ester carboxylesterase